MGMLVPFDWIFGCYTICYCCSNFTLFFFFFVCVCVCAIELKCQKVIRQSLVDSFFSAISFAIRVQVGYRGRVVFTYVWLSLWFDVMQTAKCTSVSQFLKIGVQATFENAA